MWLVYKHIVFATFEHPQATAFIAQARLVMLPAHVKHFSRGSAGVVDEVGRLSLTCTRTARFGFHCDRICLLR